MHGTFSGLIILENHQVSPTVITKFTRINCTQCHLLLVKRSLKKELDGRTQEIVFYHEIIISFKDFISAHKYIFPIKNSSSFNTNVHYDEDV